MITKNVQQVSSINIIRFLKMQVNIPCKQNSTVNFLCQLIVNLILAEMARFLRAGGLYTVTIANVSLHEITCYSNITGWHRILTGRLCKDFLQASPIPPDDFLPARGLLR